jgi:putative heme transporter
VLLAEVIASVLLSLVVLFFFLKDGPRICDALVGLIPDERQDDVRAIGARVWEALAGYVRGSAIDGAIEAVLVAVALSLLAVPLAIPLAIITFFAGFVPVVGATFAGFVAAMVALVADGPGSAIAAAAVFLVVQQVQNNVLEPVVLGRTVDLHPLAIVLTLTTGGIVAGIVGVFLAVPTAAVIAAVVRETRDRELVRSLAPQPRRSE